MRTIGLIGGMSWESTLPYYRLINEAVRSSLGGLHSAKIILYSVDFHEMEDFQARGDWEAAAGRLTGIGRILREAGADGLVLCTNTMHQVADRLEAEAKVPLLHIVDAVGQAVRCAGPRRVGLLGTRFTMEGEFYAKRLGAHGVQVVLPDRDDRALVHRIIYEELCCGQVLDGSRREILRIMDLMALRGAGGVVLGCTELSLLSLDAMARVPVFDTTRIHAGAAAKWALEAD